MFILQVNTVDTRGGAAQVAYGLKRELEKRGHQSPMFVGRKYSSDTNVFILNDMLSFSSKVRRKLAYWLANDIDVFQSQHILKTEQFKKADIIHCHNLHSNYFNLSTLEKMAKLKPVIWTFHDMWPITAHCGHSFDGGLKNGFFQCPSIETSPPIAWHNEKYLEKRKYEIYKKSFFNIVTPSKWLAKKVEQSILKDKPLSVIYNGVDTSVFRPYNKKECRQLLRLPLDKRIVLVVAKGGASNPWKGGNYAQDAIKAFGSDSSVFFINVGGDDTDHVNPNLKTVSYMANQDMLAKYYSAADILLYPSIADNCPLVVLEAMACGLSIASFNTGGIQELVDHKINGYIAEYKNADDLRVGIEYLLNLSFQEIEKMRQYSINKIGTGFTLEKMTDQYLSLYKKRD